MATSESDLSDPRTWLGLLLILGLVGWGVRGCWRSVTKPAAPDLVGMTLEVGRDSAPGGVEVEYWDRNRDLYEDGDWPSQSEVEICEQHPSAGTETWTIKLDLALLGQCEAEAEPDPKPSETKRDPVEKPSQRYNIPDVALAKAACEFAVVLNAIDGVPLSDALDDAAVTAGVDKVTMLRMHSNGCTAD